MAAGWDWSKFSAAVPLGLKSLSTNTMNELEIIVDIESLQEDVSSFASENVFPSGLDPVGKGALDGDFFAHSLIMHPRSNLFHYYSDKDSGRVDSDGKLINYSREALRSGSAHLSSPRMFNDPYDCTLSVNLEVALAACIQKCASIIGMDHLEGESAIELAGDFATKKCSRDRCQIADAPRDGNIAAISVEHFRLAMERSAGLFGRRTITADDVLAGARAVVDSSRTIGDRMRVFCLSTVCDSLTMWAYYANCHKGFCVEYDVSESFAASASSYDGRRLLLLANTRPVVYGLVRPDCTEYVVNDLFSPINQEMMDDLYLKSLYSKGLPWALESEWRIVLPQGYDLLDENDNIEFFPIRSVCAGALMEDARLESLASLCASKDLPLFKMDIDDRQYILGAHRVV